MTDSDHAGVIFPPPLLYAGALILALVVHWFWPAHILSHPITLWAGWAVLSVGFVLNTWGAYTMRRAGAPINPYEPVRDIVTSGPFRVSRNPLYVGLSLIFLGLCLILNTVWGLIGFVPLVVVMHYGVILREERYLEHRFGESYRQYRSTVRRYL